MSLHPRGSLAGLGERLKILLRARPVRRAPPRLRGKMRRAVVVPTPDPMFTEAVFILRDDALRSPGLNREALLLEASRAAERYTEQALPAREGLALHPAAWFLLGVAAALVAVWALGFL